MNTYETPEGLVIGLDHAPLYAQAMHADLVAALEIARAYQAKCERLERGCEHLDAVIAESARHVERITKERDTWRDRYTTEVPWP